MGGSEGDIEPLNAFLLTQSGQSYLEVIWVPAGRPGADAALGLLSGARDMPRLNPV